MARGRKPDPAGLQAAKGNPGKRKSKPSAPVIRVRAATFGTVAPPKWLNKSPAAAETWNTLAPLLQRLNALTQLDAFPLARYCRYVVDWLAADDAVRKEGTWFNATDTNGAATKKRHPAFHARQDLDKVLREIEGAFGMRPDARFKMLRDQAVAAGLGLGPLFGENGSGKPSDSDADAAPSEPHHDDPIGSLARFDAAPPGSRPN